MDIRSHLKRGCAKFNEQVGTWRETATAETIWDEPGWPRKEIDSWRQTRWQPDKVFGGHKASYNAK